MELYSHSIIHIRCVVHGDELTFSFTIHLARTSHDANFQKETSVLMIMSEELCPGRLSVFQGWSEILSDTNLKMIAKWIL
jgi:hypothetical protein